MGNLLSKNKDTKYERLPESIWGYKGVDSTIEGLYLSSIPDGKGGFITQLFRQDENGNRSTVWFRITSVKPTAIEIFYRENERLCVVFMIGEDRAGIDNVVWETNDFEINEKDNTLVSLKKNKKSSPSQSANGAGGSATPAPEYVCENDVARPNQNSQTYGNSGGGNSATEDVKFNQGFAQCCPSKESITGSKTVDTFTGTNQIFTVSPDSKSIFYQPKNPGKLNKKFQVEFSITRILTLTVYELLDGGYLIIIQTESGQTYLSGYLSTNATPIFATYQITSNLDDKRFKSFEHVSDTVFTCFFSDGTKRTFSIESGSYATIKEGLDA